MIGWKHVSNSTYTVAWTIGQGASEDCHSWTITQCLIKMTLLRLTLMIQISLQQIKSL